MTSPTPPTLEPLSDDIALERWLAPLLDAATHDQLWLFFLDAQDRPTGPIMPCDDLPTYPDETVSTEDLGTLTMAEVLGARFAAIMHEFGFAQVVLVWERRGSRRITERDRAWAKIGDHLVNNGARVRARFVLHDRGLRILSPDDLLAVV